MKRKTKVFQSTLLGFAFTLSLMTSVVSAAPLPGTTPALSTPTVSPSTFVATTNVNNVVTFTSAIKNAGTSKVDIIMEIHNTTESSKIIYSKFDLNEVNGQVQGYSNGTFTETWNGRDSTNVRVPAGNYYAVISAINHDNGNSFGSPVTSPTFTVSEQAPTLSYTTVAPTTYNYADAVPFNVNYNLDLGTSTSADVTLYIDKIQVSKISGITTGTNKIISWDGILNGSKVANGQHSFNLSATGDAAHFGLNATDLSSQFTISNTHVISNNAPSISNVVVSPTTYHPNTDAPVSLKYDLSKSTPNTHITAAVYSTADVNTPIKQWVANVPTTTTTTPVTTTLTWDGKSAANPTQYVGNGTYFVKVWGDEAGTALIEKKSSDFSVSTSTMPSSNLPVISGLSVNSNPYNPKNGSANLNYSIDNSNAVLMLQVLNSSNDVVSQWTNIQPTAGTNSKVWSADANLAAGTYTFKVSGTSNNQNLVSQQIPFTIGTAISLPVVSGLNVNPNPYNPKNGSANLNYSIDNNNAILTLQILNDSNGVVTQWANIQPSTGTNAKVWSADTNLANGTYTFKVSGTSNNQNLVSQQTTFTVSNSTSTNCAGFTDIAASDVNCNAYSWVKSEGIFTGNPNGTFDPNGILQRDQVAKVVLEAFGKYSNGTEYCQAGNPFADVTTSSWARQYICLGKKTMVNGVYLLTGYKSGPNAGLFLPANPVNRSEFLAIVLRNLSVSMPADSTYSYADVPVNQWDSGYAAYAAQHLTSVYPQSNLNRTQSVSRLEAARVLYALHNQGSL